MQSSHCNNMLTGLIQNWWQILFKGQNENRMVESSNG